MLPAQGARGWVVDLRVNIGGTMWPMIAGAGPLMGAGLLGRFVNAAGSETCWFYRDRVAAYQEPQPFMTAVDPASTPVAVQTSSLIGSSGETTTGEVTGGVMHDLEDGAILGIAESASADRTGCVYAEAIAPDEPLSVDWRRYGQADDLVIAAVAWLKSVIG